MKKNARGLNRCDICGLFRRWRRLKVQFTPDTAFTCEEVSYRCLSCLRPRRKGAGKR